MDSHLRDGLRIGNVVIVPHERTVTGARGTLHLSSDCIELLIALAARPDQSVTFDVLADMIDCDQASLTGRIQAIKVALGDTGPNPRFLLVDEAAATLIAPVCAGIGNAHRQLDSDDEEDSGISFFQQLQRRKVIRVGAGYLVLAWLTIQVADTVLPALGMPQWAVTLTIGLVTLGFPVALVTAWLFETTSVGTVRDKRRVPAALTREQKIADVSILTGVAMVACYFAIGVLSDVKISRDRDAVLLAPSQVIAAANTLAVIPFRLVGANAENSYIGDGIAEEILRMLSRVGELHVAARTASFFFKDKDVDLETMAQRLKVRYVLTGSVQIAGDEIRVSAELADAATGQQIWSDSFDREMADVFAIQSEIARAVADRSGQVLSESSRAALDRRPTKSPEAFDYYLRGREYLRQPRTSDVLKNAQRLFHHALALDPDYTLATAGLCETHLAVYIRMRSVATVDDAETVCRAALEIDPSLPEVHSALGFLYWHTGDFDRAEAEFRTAIDKDPNFYEAFSGLGDTLYSKNLIDQSILAYQQVINLQPAYWGGYQKIGNVHYRQGNDADALPFYQQVTDLSPDNAPGWNNLGAVNYMLGNFEVAANAYQRALEIAPTQVLYINLGTMYYYFGRYADAVEMQQESIKIAPKDYRSWGRLAAAYLQMEDRAAEAISAYNKAISLANEIIEINPNLSEAYKNIAVFYARTNKSELAEASINKAFELSPKDPDTLFFAALTYIALDDAERSIVQLERAVALGYSRKLIASEPAFTKLRDNERFKILVSEHS